MAVRLLLADDHQLVRQGVRAMLECEPFEVVAEAADGLEAVRLADVHRPDVVVLDLSMPELNGVDAAARILGSLPGVPLVLLTVHRDEHQIVAALRAGIRGYVLKTQAFKELTHAIQVVLNGGTYLSPGVSGVVVDAYLAGRHSPSDPLAPREREVLKLVADGRTSKGIASVLGLSVKSAESYRSRIMDKLDIHDTAGLVRYAIRHGLVEL